MTLMTTLSDDERLFSAIVHHIASASSSVSDVRTLRDLPDKLLYLRATLFLTNGLRNISYRGHWTRRITGSTSRRPVQSSSVCALWTCCVCSTFHRCVDRWLRNARDLFVWLMTMIARCAASFSNGTECGVDSSVDNLPKVVKGLRLCLCALGLSSGTEYRCW